MRRIVPTTFFLALNFLVWTLVPPASQAFEQDQDQPMRINARAIEANEKTGVTVYRDNVSFEQGGLSIRADRVEIHAPQHQAESIVATGKPVKVRQHQQDQADDFLAEANRLEFHVAQQELIMSDNVTLRRGKDIFTSDTLHYNLNKKTLSAEGGDADGRISAIIQPKKSAHSDAPKP